MVNTWLLVQSIVQILSFLQVSSRFPTSLKTRTINIIRRKCGYLWYLTTTGMSRIIFATAIVRSSALVLLFSFPTTCLTGIRAGSALNASTGSETTTKISMKQSKQK